MNQRCDWSGSFRRYVFLVKISQHIKFESQFLERCDSKLGELEYTINNYIVKVKDDVTGDQQ